MKKIRISESDIELFRKSVGNIEKIRQEHRVILKTPGRKSVHNQQRHDPGTVTGIPATSINSALTTGDALYFKRPGLQQRVMEKLRRGQIKAEKELDLHGLTAVDAEKKLVRFLGYCQQNDYRCIRIIHGKGRGSRDGKPVLKTRINQWLQSNSNVLAFCSAKINDGGTGAVYVLIKTANRKNRATLGK